LTATEYPEILKAFEENKQKTIHFLLHLLKTYIDDKSERFKLIRTINTFINFGVKWPEFDVIEKSLKHEIKNYKKV
jgi:hypothetical protein